MALVVLCPYHILNKDFLNDGCMLEIYDRVIRIGGVHTDPFLAHTQTKMIVLECAKTGDDDSMEQVVMEACDCGTKMGR